MYILQRYQMPIILLGFAPPYKLLLSCIASIFTFEEYTENVSMRLVVGRVLVIVEGYLLFHIHLHAFRVYTMRALDDALLSRIFDEGIWTGLGQVFKPCEHRHINTHSRT